MNVDVVVVGVGGDGLKQGRAGAGTGLHGPGRARANNERDYYRAGDVAWRQVDMRSQGGRGEVTRLEGVTEMVAGDGIR
jgi:hypothetical protein